MDAGISLGLIGVQHQFYGQLLGLLGDPTAESREITDLIAVQPVLSARLLRVANSPYYGQSRRITTVQRAAILLGREAVRCVAAMACINTTMIRRLNLALPDVTAYLEHSIATAIIAESLARLRAPECSADAFPLGILHNLGVALQACVDPQRTRQMVAARQSGNRDPIRVLEARFSVISHEECIAILLDTWCLPIEFIQAAGDHHRGVGNGTPQAPLAALIAAASSLALSVGYCYSLDRAPDTDVLDGADQFGMLETEILELRASVRPRVELLCRGVVS